MKTIAQHRRGLLRRVFLCLGLLAAQKMCQDEKHNKKNTHLKTFQVRLMCCQELVWMVDSLRTKHLFYC